MRRAARLAAALARGAAGAGELACWPASAAPSAAACRGLAAAALRPLPAAASLLPRAAAAAAASRPSLPSASRLLGTAAPAPAAASAGAPAAEEPAPWRLVGRVDKPFTLQPKDAFAVVQAGPHQFKVTVDDLIYVEKMHGVDINDKARVFAAAGSGSGSGAAPQTLPPHARSARWPRPRLARSRARVTPLLTPRRCGRWHRRCRCRAC
jgi:hypothetical protein